MKTLNITAIVIALSISFSSMAIENDGKFIENMQKNIQLVYEAKTIDELQAAVNAFERIGAVEKTKWEPQYYAAFGYIMMSTKDGNGSIKDLYLDQAIAAIEKGKIIAPEESELLALEGFAYMMRVSVDPAARGAQFAPVSVQSYKRALQLNPENPRALALLAQMQYGTAQFFGSSTTEACDTMKLSLQKFETYKSENPIAPTWGKKVAESMQADCK